MRCVSVRVLLYVCAFIAGCSKEPFPSLELSIKPVTDSLTGIPIKFSADVSNTPDSYRWDFGDGSSSTQASPAHTYLKMGTYYVSLKAELKGSLQTVSYKLVIKGDGRLAGTRRYAGVYTFHSLQPNGQATIITRVIPDTTLSISFRQPFELTVFTASMTWDHDTGTEVQYQNQAVARPYQFLRYYPARDSIFIRSTTKEVPGSASSTYEFVSKK